MTIFLTETPTLIKHFPAWKAVESNVHWGLEQSEEINKIEKKIRNKNTHFSERMVTVWCSYSFFRANYFARSKEYKIISKKTMTSFQLVIAMTDIFILSVCKQCTRMAYYYVNLLYETTCTSS